MGCAMTDDKYLARPIFAQIGLSQENFVVYGLCAARRDSGQKVLFEIASQDDFGPDLKLCTGRILALHHEIEQRFRG
jgi:hypothetical protein